MTDQEARMELDRVVKNLFPLIDSKMLDQDTMLKVAHEITYEATEWRGVNFPYKRLNDKFLGLIHLQYGRCDNYSIFQEIKEYEVVDFLNKYYRWHVYEEEKQSKELENNPFELSEQDEKDFDEFKKIRPIPCMEPLDVEGYLHMCRIGYDAAPMFAYPDFVSDLNVIAHAKFDSCHITNQKMHKKMKVGDTHPWFMSYHAEEMGFGGPDVWFEWENDGWVMFLISDKAGREKNMNMHRFLAMRRAGYPVIFMSSDDMQVYWKQKKERKKNEQR